MLPGSFDGFEGGLQISNIIEGVKKSKNSRNEQYRPPQQQHTRRLWGDKEHLLSFQSRCRQELMLNNSKIGGRGHILTRPTFFITKKGTSSNQT